MVKQMRFFMLLTAILVVVPTSSWAAPLIDVSPLMSVVHLVTFVCVLIVIIKGVFSSPYFKGKRGEARVRARLADYLDSEIYQQLHDVTLQTSDGTTQIDHIIVSQFGIFVIETKNMGGWIFGREHDAQWRQVFPGRKTSFQNPLRQNYKHIKTIEEVFGVDATKLFSVVAFAGDAEFKTPMPENVVQLDRLIRYIKSKDVVRFQSSEVQFIVRAISTVMLGRSVETEQQHIQNLRQRFGEHSIPCAWLPNNVMIRKVVVVCMAVFVSFILLSHTKPPVQPAQSIQPVSKIPISMGSVQPVPALPSPISQSITPLATAAARIPLPQAESSPTLPAEINPPAHPVKTPQSDEYGLLTLSACKDTYVTLYNADKKDVAHMELKKGQSKQIEIKKGVYTAEILQQGKREVSSLSFIGTIGTIEF